MTPIRPSCKCTGTNQCIVLALAADYFLLDLKKLFCRYQDYNRIFFFMMNIHALCCSIYFVFLMLAQWSSFWFVHKFWCDLGTMLIGTSGPAIFIHYHKLWNPEHAQLTFNLRTRFLILIPPPPEKEEKMRAPIPLKTLKSNYFYIKMLFFHSIKFLSLLMQSNSGKLFSFHITEHCCVLFPYTKYFLCFLYCIPLFTKNPEISLEILEKTHVYLYMYRWNTDVVSSRSYVPLKEDRKKCVYAWNRHFLILIFLWTLIRSNEKYLLTNTYID